MTSVSATRRRLAILAAASAFGLTLSGCGGESLESTPETGYVAPPAPGGEMKPAAKSRRAPSRGVPLGFVPTTDAASV